MRSSAQPGRGHPRVRFLAKKLPRIFCTTAILGLLVLSAQILIFSRLPQWARLALAADSVAAGFLGLGLGTLLGYILLYSHWSERGFVSHAGLSLVIGLVVAALLWNLLPQSAVEVVENSACACAPIVVTGAAGEWDRAVTAVTIGLALLSAYFVFLGLPSGRKEHLLDPLNYDAVAIWRPVIGHVAVVALACLGLAFIVTSRHPAPPRPTTLEEAFLRLQSKAPRDVFCGNEERTRLREIIKSRREVLEERAFDLLDTLHPKLEEVHSLLEPACCQLNIPGNPRPHADAMRAKAGFDVVQTAVKEKAEGSGLFGPDVARAMMSILPIRPTDDIRGASCPGFPPETAHYRIGETAPLKDWGEREGLALTYNGRTLAVCIFTSTENTDGTRSLGETMLRLEASGVAQAIEEVERRLGQPDDARTIGNQPCRVWDVGSSRMRIGAEASEAIDITGRVHLTSFDPETSNQLRRRYQQENRETDARWTDPHGCGPIRVEED